MRHIESLYREHAYAERLVFLYGFHQLFGQLAVYLVVCPYSLVYDFSGIYRDVEVYGKSRYGGNVVGVVVGEEYRAYFPLVHAILGKMLFHLAVADAGIYQNAVF